MKNLGTTKSIKKQKRKIENFQIRDSSTSTETRFAQQEVLSSSIHLERENSLPAQVVHGQTESAVLVPQR